MFSKTANKPLYLDPKVWGPHYWFFLHTIAMTYPHHPNSVTKKKYYEFIQNLPLFIPVEEISNHLSHLIDKYPIHPYLDNRDSFVRWMHFIHNKINQRLERPDISLSNFFINYYEQYKTPDEKWLKYYHLQKKVIYVIVVLSIAGLIYYLYDK